MSSPMSQMMARLSAKRYMKSTCQIMRPTFTSDGRVGRTATYATVGTSICRKLHRVSTTTDQTNRVTVVNSDSVFLPSDADVQMTDRLVIMGRTYEVQGLSTDDTLEVQMIATCVEIK